MSPNADLLLTRCARISAPAMPLSQTHPTLPRLRPSLLPLPPPRGPLSAITQCTMTTHGPPSCKSIHTQILNRTVHHPSSSMISMSMSSTRTNNRNNNNNIITTTTTTTNNNNKIQPRVSLPSNQPSTVQPLIPSFVPSLQSLTTLLSKFHLRLRIVRRRTLYTIIRIRRRSPPCFLLFLHSILAM